MEETKSQVSLVFNFLHLIQQITKATINSAMNNLTIFISIYEYATYHQNYNTETMLTHHTCCFYELDRIMKFRWMETYQVKCICFLCLSLPTLLGCNAILFPSLNFPHVIRRLLGWSTWKINMLTHSYVLHEEKSQFQFPKSPCNTILVLQEKYVCICL